MPTPGLEEQKPRMGVLPSLLTEGPRDGLAGGDHEGKLGVQGSISLPLLRDCADSYYVPP